MSGFAPAEEGQGGDPALVLDLDGYEGPIDLLLVLAREQKVDWSFIAVEVKHQRRVAGLPLLGGGKPAHSPCPVIASTKWISPSAGPAISQPSRLKPKALRAPA